MTQRRDIRQLRVDAKQPVNVRGGGATLAEFFQVNRDRIKSALPKGQSVEQMLTIAQHAIRTTPFLQRCTVESLFGSTVQAATLGLPPNDPRGLSYLVPFKNNKRSKAENRDIYDCQLIIGYRGFIELARRSGEVESIIGRAVYENDEISIIQGSTEELIHKPIITGERGDLIGTYAIARMKGAQPIFVWCPIDYIERIRGTSKNAFYNGSPNPNSPWTSDYDAMAIKTAVRQIQKWVPLSPEMRTAIEVDNAGEAGRQSSARMTEDIDGEFSVVPSGMEVEDQDDADDGDQGDGADDGDQGNQGSQQGQAADGEESAMQRQSDSLRKDIGLAETIEDVEQFMDYAKQHLSGGYLSAVTRSGNQRKLELAPASEEGENDAAPASQQGDSGEDSEQASGLD